MNSRIVLALLAGACALTGCAQTHTGLLRPIDQADFGESNRQTYAAMVVDPDPQYDEPLATSAERAALAADRYRKGAVEQPDSVSTTSGGGGGN